jgi:hypothetical protein
MGRDKRLYRFLHDTWVGRRVLGESYEIADLVKAVTAYVARRLVERERALDEDPDVAKRFGHPAALRRQRRRRGWGTLLLGFFLGAITLLMIVLFLASRV